MTDRASNTRVARRLAAILAADIAGYSALMGADEEATVRDLKSHQAVILPMIAGHGGRVIDTAGDGILAEFASVLAAVKCALEMQTTMATRNASIDPGRRMQFRIGINQGDVVFDDARVYGDGVNIAARLEVIAEPGGICISDKVYQEIRAKIDLHYQDLGRQHFKNISESVRVFRVEPDVPATTASQAKSPLALPDKPSVAVLPFTNLSGDSSQEYFSDGITEDIITELSRFSELFVIARNSSFQYKGKSPDIREVGRELGVRYVLEGSIRRAGDRVRITGQLIDAATGAHRWAERYDRELRDVFAVQDEAARTIAAILVAHVNKAETERTLLKPPIAWQAYDYYLQAKNTFASFLSSWDVRELYKVRSLLEQSLTIDPKYARAYAHLAWVHMALWVNALDDSYLRDEIRDKAHQLARKAAQLDPNLPQAHAELAWVLTYKGETDAALAAMDRAIELNPNFSEYRFAAVLILAGQAARAIRMLEGYRRLDPFYPPMAPGWLGFAFYAEKKYAEAVSPLRECVQRAPNFRGGHFWLAATYARLGMLEEAKREATECLRIDPTYTISRTARRLSHFKYPQDAEHYFEGLRGAGHPEN